MIVLILLTLSLGVLWRRRRAPVNYDPPYHAGVNAIHDAAWPFNYDWE